MHDGEGLKAKTNSRRRWVFLSIVLIVIPVGLAARSYRDGADSATVVGFIISYAGDTLWATMFFFVFAWIWPDRSSLRLAGVTLFVTLGIEFSQLYHGESLKTLRGFKPTGFLLGSCFLWSDVACLFVGTLLAIAVYHALAQRRHARV